MATKSFLLYSVVVQIGEEMIPICELISSNHDGVTIGNFFRWFRYYAEIVNMVKWYPFKAFCTDGSAALLQGVCSGLNNMPVSQYFRYIYIYKVVTGEFKVQPDT